MPTKKHGGRAVRVMVTRPADQAETISQQLNALGVEVVRFPTIVIRDLSHQPKQCKIAQRAGSYQLLIFISSNAVEYGLRALMHAGVQIKELQAVAAIGQSTAARLRAHGIMECAYPTQPCSEALLELPVVRNLQSSARVLIVRGQGGKESLAHALRRQGAQLDYLEAYSREQPAKSACAWQADVDLIMVSSAENLYNLVKMIEENQRQSVLQTPVLLGSRSMLAMHKQLGFNVPAVIASTPMDKDMIAAFSRWRERTSMHRSL